MKEKNFNKKLDYEYKCDIIGFKKYLIVGRVLCTLVN